MDISGLLGKKKRYEAVKDSIPEATRISLENAFEVEYTHHSTAIEGNTLTLMETKVVLEDGIAIGGKSLREIYEVVSHNKAYQYVKECIGKGLALEENIVKDIHALLMNYQLMGKGFLPVSVAKEDSLVYYNALDQYAAYGRLDDFAEMIALLEEKKLDKYLKLAATQEQDRPFSY